MRITICCLLLMFQGLTAKAQTLQKAWETPGFENPESVIFDKVNNVYYVSNVAGSPTEKDGNGYISQLDANGKMLSKSWVGGLNAPKGMGIHGGKLYVADIDEIRVINIATASVEKSLPVPGASFLNDIAVAPNGDVYVSDTFGGSSVFRIKNQTVELFLKDDKLDSPNGLLVKGNDLMVLSWGVITNQQTFETAVKGKLIRVSIADKRITDVSKPFTNGDGIVPYKNGFITSDWAAGKIFFIDNKGAYKEIGSFNSGTADIELTSGKNARLLIPQMAEGKVMAFSLK